METLPRVGDEVELPAGLPASTGVVRAVYGPPARPHALIQLQHHGADGQPLDDETTISIPAHLVRVLVRA